jgi:hypothetical protein
LNCEFSNPSEELLKNKEPKIWKIGNAYKHPDFNKDTIIASSILAGEEGYFKPLEIEVLTRKPSQNNSQALYVLFIKELVRFFG